MDSETLAKNILQILDDKRAEDLRCFDVRGKSSVTDFNVLATGMAPPHLRALVSAVRSEMTKKNVPSYRQSGEPESGWVVLDYVDVIVHVFTREARRYYDLEDLWKDSPELKPQAEA